MEKEFCVPATWSICDTARRKLNARYFAFSRDQEMVFLTEDFDVWRLRSEKVEGKLSNGETVSLHLVFGRISRDNLKPDSPVNPL